MRLTNFQRKPIGPVDLIADASFESAFVREKGWLRGLATNIICSSGGRQRERSAAVRSLFWLAILDELRNSLLRTA
jgi:hypothetical protein